MWKLCMNASFQLCVVNNSRVIAGSYVINCQAVFQSDYRSSYLCLKWMSIPWMVWSARSTLIGVPMDIWSAFPWQHMVWAIFLYVYLSSVYLPWYPEVLRSLGHFLFYLFRYNGSMVLLIMIVFYQVMFFVQIFSWSVLFSFSRQCLLHTKYIVSAIPSL